MAVVDPRRSLKSAGDRVYIAFPAASLRRRGRAARDGGAGARARSSAGEHYVDIVGVAGSNPAAPTTQLFEKPKYFSARSQLLRALLCLNKSRTAFPCPNNLGNEWAIRSCCVHGEGTALGECYGNTEPVFRCQPNRSPYNARGNAVAMETERWISRRVEMVMTVLEAANG